MPAPIDVPLQLGRAGDEEKVTLCGVRIKSVLVPGHSSDSVLYAMELGGKRILFTGDIGLKAARTYCTAAGETRTRPNRGGRYWLPRKKVDQTRLSG